MITNEINIIPSDSFWLISLIFAFLISTTMMPLIIKINKWLNCFDTPDQRKIHQNKTATMGGIGIFVSLFITYIFLSKFNLPLYFWFSLSILLITGILDDIYGIRWFIKLFFQATASFIFIVMGFNYSVLFEQAGLDFIPVFLQPIGLVIFIILYINAFNLIDGMDGLAGGLALINFSVFGILNFHFGNFPLAWMCITLSGALIGFLVFNTHPAKIFMGDTGSMIIGFLLIVAAFNTFQFHYHINELGIYEKKMFIWVISGILLLPFLDAVRVFVVRLMQKKAPYLPGKDHIHHLLLKTGLSQKQVVVILYAINVLFVLSGLIVYLNKPISVIVSVLLLKM